MVAIDYWVVESGWEMELVLVEVVFGLLVYWMKECKYWKFGPLLEVVEMSRSGSHGDVFADTWSNGNQPRNGHVVDGVIHHGEDVFLSGRPLRAIVC